MDLFLLLPAFVDEALLRCGSVFERAL
jgi:hypothetical protein